MFPHILSASEKIVDTFFIATFFPGNATMESLTSLRLKHESGYESVGNEHLIEKKIKKLKSPMALLSLSGMRIKRKVLTNFVSLECLGHRKETVYSQL